MVIGIAHGHSGPSSSDNRVDTQGLSESNIILMKFIDGQKKGQ